MQPVSYLARPEFVELVRLLAAKDYAPSVQLKAAMGFTVREFRFALWLAEQTALKHV